MRINRIIMENYRKNPEKVREIFETARNTDMDRSELVTHLEYLGNDRSRERDSNVIPYLGLACSSVGTLGISVLGISDTSKPLFFAGLAATTFFAAYLIKNSLRMGMGILPNIRNYTNARKDAIRNIETRAQTD